MSIFVYGDYRIKMVQGQNDAAEQQPWRCVKCNTPVRLGRGDPCKCIQHLLKKASTR